MMAGSSFMMVSLEMVTGFCAETAKGRVIRTHRTFFMLKGLSG